MNTAYLLLGSNIGSREKFLSSALACIQLEVGSVQIASSVIETEPWGYENQAKYLNQCLKILSNYPPLQLLYICKQVENKIGRTKSFKWGPREIDIDILFFNDEIIQTENLIIPHPFILERPFALELMCQIAPDYIHPLVNNSIKNIYKQNAVSLKTYQ